MYNETVIDHFNHPRNLGELAEASAKGESPLSDNGDKIFVFLAIEDNLIKEARFKTFGNAAAIAASSILTTMIVNQSLAYAKALVSEDIVVALGDLPPAQINCAALAIAALQQAIKNYEDKQ